MTGNQINYWNLQETKRSNAVQEQLKSEAQAEARRSNLANEGIKNKDIDSQISRREHQSATDTVNAITGGVKNMASAATGIAGLFI